MNRQELLTRVRCVLLLKVKNGLNQRNRNQATIIVSIKMQTAGLEYYSR